MEREWYESVENKHKKNHEEKKIYSPLHDYYCFSVIHWENYIRSFLKKNLKKYCLPVHPTYILVKGNHQSQINARTEYTMHFLKKCGISIITIQR